MNNSQCQFNECSEVHFDYIFNQDAMKTVHIPYHTLFFVYSGKLVIKEKSRNISVKKGEYIFLKSDTIITFFRKDCGEESFRGVYIGFSKSFLYEFYRNFCRGKIISKKESSLKNVVKLSYTPYIQSIYVSMKPYLEWNTKPSRNILELKRLESIYSLLIADERFYMSLFDFIDPDECVIYHYMNKKYLN